MNSENIFLYKITGSLILSVNTRYGIRSNISNLRVGHQGFLWIYDRKGHFLKFWIWLFWGFREYLYKIWQICVVWLLRYGPSVLAFLIFVLSQPLGGISLLNASVQMLHAQTRQSIQVWLPFPNIKCTFGTLEVMKNQLCHS